MKIYALYFSPTGGTKKVLDTISAAWDCEKIEMDLSDRNCGFSEIVFEKEDVCIVAVPSFSGRVPQFILPKLEQMNGKGTRAVLVTAYGNREFDDTLLELKDTLRLAGFRCMCAVAAVTQHSLMPKYGSGRPDAADLQELETFAEKCKEAVENAAEEAEVPGSRPYREYLSIPIKPKADKNCNKCGFCMKKCPVQAITADTIKSADKNKCISCLKCVSVCPRHSRHINLLMTTLAEIRMKKACSGRKKNALFLPSSKLPESHSAGGGNV